MPTVFSEQDSRMVPQLCLLCRESARFYIDPYFTNLTDCIKLQLKALLCQKGRALLERHLVVLHQRQKKKKVKNLICLLSTDHTRNKTTCLIRALFNKVQPSLIIASIIQL